MRKDRFSHRQLGKNVVQAALEADDAAVGYHERRASRAASSEASPAHDDDSQDAEVQLELLGEAADGQSSTQEPVLFVHALSRDPSMHSTAAQARPRWPQPP